MNGEIAFADGDRDHARRAGIVSMPGKGDLQAGGTTLVIPELGRLQPRGDLHLELSGPVSALAALSDTPPLSVAAEQGIVADTLSGDGDLSLDANLPLYAEFGREARAALPPRLDGFLQHEPDRGAHDRRRRSRSRGNPEELHGEGGGHARRPAGLRRSDPRHGRASQTDVAVTLDDAARERLGLTFGGLVTGPIKAPMKSLDENRQEVALDLKTAQISLPFLGWEKGPGVPATASFVMEKTEERTRDHRSRRVGERLCAPKGSLTVGPDGQRPAAEARQGRASPRRPAFAHADRRRQQATTCGSTGAALDARGIIRSIGADSGGGRRGHLPDPHHARRGSVTGQNDVVAVRTSPARWW